MSIYAQAVDADAVRGLDFDESLIVFSRERAAELSGLRQGTLDYWRRTGLIVPTTDRRLSSQRPVRLYSFVDMMSLMVVAQLRARKVSLQRVRRVVRELKETGYERPLVELVFGVQRRTKRWSLYFQHEDGSWAGEREPAQLVMRETLDLAEIRARLHNSRRRDPADVGRVETRRGALGSKPLLAGTRVPVATVQRYLAGGVADSEILVAFPVLELADIEAARTHVA